MQTNLPPIIKSESDLQRMVRTHIGRSFAYDIESSGLSPQHDRLLGVSFCFDNGNNYYVVLEHTDPAEPRKNDQPNTIVYLTPDQIRKPLNKLFHQTNVMMVAHNSKFDMRFLKAAGITIEGRMFDTMLAAKITDENHPSYGLKDLSWRLLGEQMDHYQDLEQYEGFGKDEFLAVPLEPAAKYALADTRQTWKLYERLEPLLKSEGVDKAFYGIWMKLTPVLADMEDKGVALNIDNLKEFRESIIQQSEKMEWEVWREGIAMILSQSDEDIPQHFQKIARNVDPEFVDEEQTTWTYQGVALPVIRKNARTLPRLPYFNVGSVKHLSELLYDYYGLRPPEGVFLNKSNNGRSVDRDTLEVLRIHYGEKAPKALVTLLEWRKLNKLVTAFLDPMIDRADPSDHYCLRTTFNQHVTDTGRLSSSSPNLQQVPSRGKQGQVMRSLFVARPGHKLIVADFSQMELRIIAHYSRDPNYIQAFEEGRDLHIVTASNQFDMDYEELKALVDAEDVDAKTKRSIGKTSNFALSYGMGAKKFKTRLLVDSGVDVSLEEAQRLIDDFNATYAGAYQWKLDVAEWAKKLGYVRTLSGRKRRLPNIYSHDRYEVMRAERQSSNACVQGSAGDIAAAAMIEAQRQLQPLGAYLLLQVHDEVMVEAPEDKADQAKEILEWCMTDYVNELFKMRVPLIAEASIADNWSDAKG